MASQIRYLGLILLVLVALAVIACGDNEPLPDIDATVEASVKRAIASLVVPTLAPLPTYTPMPTYTPVPRVIPIMGVPRKEVVIEKIVVQTVVVVLTATPLPAQPAATAVPVNKVVVAKAATAVPAKAPVVIKVPKEVVVEKEVAPVAKAVVEKEVHAEKDKYISDDEVDEIVAEVRFTQPHNILLYRNPSGWFQHTDLYYESLHCYAYYLTNISGDAIYLGGWDFSVEGLTDKHIHIKRLNISGWTSGGYSSGILLGGQKIYAEGCFDNNVSPDYDRIEKMVFTIPSQFEVSTDCPYANCEIERTTNRKDSFSIFMDGIGWDPQHIFIPFEEKSKGVIYELEYEPLTAAYLEQLGPSLFNLETGELNLDGDIEGYLEIVPIPEYEFDYEFDEAGLFLKGDVPNKIATNEREQTMGRWKALRWKIDNLSDTVLRFGYCVVEMHEPPLEEGTIRGWSCPVRKLNPKRSTEVSVSGLASGGFLAGRSRLLGIWIVENYW